jgi:methionyl-tRNA formyltransferase
VSTVFLGTSEFAAAVLERLAQSAAHRPSLVVTRPDRPSGRGRRLRTPPVAERARALGLAVEQPASINDPATAELIARARPAAIVICAFGALIKEPLLSDYEMFNVHPSLLPRWRGAAPIERAIEAGDGETGVTIMRPIAELDAGPVCLQRSEPIDPDDDYGTLASRLAALGGVLLVEALDSRPGFSEQSTEGVTYADKIDAADRRLDPALRAAQLERQVRALRPHIGAWIELAGDERLGVRRAVVSEEGPPAGELAARDGRLLYGTREGALELLEVHPPGRRPMPASAYLRGHATELDRERGQNAAGG